MQRRGTYKIWRESEENYVSLFQNYRFLDPGVKACDSEASIERRHSAMSLLIDRPVTNDG
jgi:hypothetical protein